MINIINNNMKTIDNYINEKLKISKSTKSQYNYFPKDANELREILEERLAKDKNANLNDIDVSEITDTRIFGSRGLFTGLDPHNIDISDWDVSNFKIMRCMFDGCENFDCDLGKWDVSSVRDMCYMFEYCTSFKGKGLENWDVSNVKNTYYMFDECINFDCDLSNWNVKNVECMDCMFYGCYKFKGKGLDEWKLDSIDSTNNMFRNCRAIKRPIWYKDLI